MMTLDIRARMLLAALLPVSLICLVLATAFQLSRFDDMQQSYHQRNRLVVRQLALSGEYGLFAANVGQLKALAEATLLEPDVRAVAFLDRSGQVLTQVGSEGQNVKLAYTDQVIQWFDDQRRLDWLAEPVLTKSVQLDAVYEHQQSGTNGAVKAVQMGQVQVVFSRRTLQERQQDLLLLSIGVGLLGLLFGALLAVYLSRGVLLPIMRVTRQIERIGKGDFSATEYVPAGHAHDPLRGLQERLQSMANQLASAQDDLQRQVRQVTQALREKKEEAELANQAKSRFLAAASHDLRQPTHALGIFISRLAQLSHDEHTAELIRNLESSVMAMQNLLSGLLDISRLEAQAVEVDKKAVDLEQLFMQLRHDLEPLAQDKGLRLRLRSKKLWVHSDPALLYRIALNLVGNALRYTERGGVLVAVRLCQDGRHVKLQVIDSGIGIAPEHQQAVFLEFYQVAEVARPSGKGLGLGLSIVQRTAALLEHPFQMASRLGHGTCFTLVLPLTRLQQAASVAAPVLASDDLRDVRILVVEDDLLVRTALAGLLRAWGMQVFEALDWNETRQHLDAGRIPEVVISDFRLPEGENGLAVIRQLRERVGQQLPACLVSGDTDEGLTQQAQALGLTLLHKPVRPARLRSLLRHLLQQRGTDQRAESADFL